MQVRTGHSSGGADKADLLPARHRVANGDQLLREMEVGAREAGAVIDVHDVAAVEEGINYPDDAPVRRPHRGAGGPGEVGAHVPRLDLAVVLAPSTETTRYAGLTRVDERR